MNSRNLLAKPVVAHNKIQTQQPNDVFSKETSQNNTVPTNSNDVVEPHQLVTSIAFKSTKSWLRQHRYHQMVIQSQHIPHNNSLAAGTIRNTQNAAFQLIETTSLYLLDWYFKPSADLSSSRASDDPVVNTQNVD
ncbi:family II extracell lipase 3 family protein [Dorcoceras hygrometricum]|uniref:Family II extracell lipase 3 family protein n=1 Tax=Dorcoceras hygrometricum TaxID=472368 RepID=A0A2Z7A0V4_9LAMI|nr:family II extracell lipase 3 family protein [Dorcoceras hygrometricum]